MINSCYLLDKFYQNSLKIQNLEERHIDLQRCYKKYLVPEKLKKKALGAFEKVKQWESHSGLRSHETLKGWYIRHTIAGPQGRRNVLRPIFNKYLKQIIKKENLKIVLPKEYLVIKPGKEDKDKYGFYDFFVISEKLDLKNSIENMEYIQKFLEKEKKKLAIKICNFIWYTWFRDVHFNNFMYTKDGKILTCIDNEPFKVMVLKGESEKPSDLHSLRIKGFNNFKHWVLKDLALFHKKYEVKEEQLSKKGKECVENKKTVGEVLENKIEMIKDKSGLPHNHNPNRSKLADFSDHKFIYEKDFLKDFGNKDVFVKTINRYLKYAHFMKKHSHFMKILKVVTIVLSILCPLIPLIVLTSSLAYAAIHNIGYYFKNLHAKKLPPVIQPV